MIWSKCIKSFSKLNYNILNPTILYLYIHNDTQKILNFNFLNYL